MEQELKKALIRVLPFVMLFVVICVLLVKQKIKKDEIALRKPASWSRYAFWLIGFLLYMSIEELLASRLGLLKPDPWHYGVTSTIIRLTGIIILAPITEEIIFRGVILNMLIKTRLSFHLAVFVQAFVFMLCHSNLYEVSAETFYYFVFGLLDGMLYAYARFNTASICTPISMHMMGNTVAVAERFLFS